MNYLETGLPLSDFVRRKSDFSPPRFIPLCSLGRKYRGLESLTRREVGKLVDRLSEPKRNAVTDDVTSDLDTVRRKATPGTGRFVGQKKMSSFEIEKMVDRLYSRRSTKDYSFVDETVDANDIINMTNRNDSDDSENEAEENKDVKERQNSILRGNNNVKTTTGCDRKSSPCFKTRRENTAFVEPKYPQKNRNIPEMVDISAVPSVNKNKQKASVTFQRAKSMTEIKKSGLENQVATDKSNNDRSLTKPEMIRSFSSPGQRSQPSPTQKFHTSLSPRDHPQSSSFSKRTNINKSEKADDKSKDFLSQAVAPKSHGAELTRPTSSNFFLLLETPEDVNASKVESSAGKTDKANEKGPVESTDASFKSTQASKKLEPPAQKGSKPPRFAATPCDELLIDRVATYNRTPKLRCK